MTYIDVQYQPGTQKSPQQTSISAPFFTDTDHVHFPDSRLSTLPPYAVASLSSDYVELLGGVRAIHAVKITGANVGTYFLPASNTRLYAIKNSTLYNISPMADQKAESLGSDPLSFTNADATMVVTWTAHGLSVGDYVTFTGATNAASVNAATYINIRHRVTVIGSANTFEVELGTTAGSTTTGGGPNVTVFAEGRAAILGANPLAVVNTDATMTVTYASHGLAVGDRIKLSGATDFAGITANTYINIEHIVATVVNANSFTVELGTTASSTASGGGSVVSIFRQIAAGNLEQDAATGYGVGLYGEDIYGVGGPSAGAQVFPRIWSFGNFGNSVVMCAGDYSSGDGQKIYIWDGDITKSPTILANAPINCNWVAVINNSIVAICGEAVKIAEQGSTSVWSGITYYEKSLERVWKIIACHAFNEKNAVLFTPNEAILLRYVGGGEIWDLSDLFSDDGLIGPYAATMLDSSMYWRGYRGAYMYNGAPPTRIENEQNEDWVIEDTNYGKNWKSFCYTDPQNHEWYYHYASTGSSEPDSYVIHNVKNGSHTLGLMDRTAAQRPSVIDSTFFLANSTSTTVAGSIYRHFTLGSVTFDWYATTSLAYGMDAEARVMVDQFFPDSNQSGTITLNILSKEYPQGTLFQTSDYSVTPSTEWLSTKAAGKLIGFKFSGNVAFTIGAWKMNLRKLGRRN